MIDQAVVVAVGRGTQLLPLTRERPRAMLPILGKPLVARVMEQLREAGIKRFVVVLGEDGGQIAAYLKQSWYPDLDIQFSLHMMASTGLATALAGAAQYLDGPFLLVSSEVMVAPDFYTQLFRQYDLLRKDIILGVAQAHYSQPGSFFPVKTLRTAVEAIAVRQEQLPEAKYGAFWAFACGEATLPYLTGERAAPYRDTDMVAVIRQMIDDGLKVGYALTDWYLRLMGVNDLLLMNRHFLTDERDAHILSELPGSVSIVPPVRIDPQVSVGKGARIGPHVYLESGASVGPRAEVNNAVVLAGGAVPSDSKIENRIVTPK